MKKGTGMRRGLERKTAYIIIVVILIGIVLENVDVKKVYADDITVEFDGSGDYLVSMTDDAIMLSRYHRRRNSSVYWTYKTVGFVISLSELETDNIEKALQSGTACEIDLISNRDIYNTDNVQSIYTIDKNSLCEAIDSLGIEFEAIDAGESVNVYISNVFVVYKRTLENGVEVKAEYESDSLYNRSDMDSYLYEQAGLTWGASGTNIDNCYNNVLSVTWNIKYGVSVEMYDAETKELLEDAMSLTGMCSGTQLFRGQEWEVSAECDEFMCNGVIYKISDSPWMAECNEKQMSESGCMEGRKLCWRHVFAGDTSISIWCQPVGIVEVTPTATMVPTATATLTATVTPTVTVTPQATPKPTSAVTTPYEVLLKISGTDGTGWVKGGGYVNRGKTTYISTNAMDKYAFIGWYLDDECVSTDKGCTITVTKDVTYTARYKEIVSPTPKVTITKVPVVSVTPDYIEDVADMTEKPQRIIRRALQSGFVREGEIVSDVESGSCFDVRNGIATQEYLAVWFQVVPYILEYDLEKVCGKQIYEVEFRRKYLIEWKNADGEQLREEKNVSVIVPVEKSYSYWQVNEFEYYTFSKIVLENDAFKTKSIELDTINEKIPDVILERRDSHIQEPDAVKYGVELEKCVLRSENTQKPVVDVDGFRNEVYELVDEEREDGRSWVDEIKVFNDILIFDGVSLFEEAECKGSGGAANVEIFDFAECFESDRNAYDEYMYALEDRNIYKNKIEIDIVENGEYETKGKITYKSHGNSMGDNTELSEIIESPFLNVFVQTPVYCEAIVKADNDKYVQLTEPMEDVVNLVIDADTTYNDFVLKISNYGSVGVTQGLKERDFSYLMRDGGLSNVKMAGEGPTKIRNEVLLPFGVYVDAGNNYDKTDDYYVEAGKWIVIGRETQRFYIGTSVSEGFYTAKVRTIAVNCGENTTKEELRKNSDYENYVAVDFFAIRVSGRVFGMEINNVNAESWDKGITYAVGELNEYGVYNGSGFKERLPLHAGSNPMYEKAGVLKKGTIVDFSVKMTGDVLKYGSFIVITPKFYHVDAEGNNRKAVDMYYDFYDKTGEKHLLVLSGGSEDRQNYIYRVMPDGTGSSVPIICGYSEIVLKSTCRTEVSEMKYKYSGFYTLPEGAHFVEKNFDVYGYGDKKGITYKEDFWIRGGYIIVNFDIVVYDGDYNKQLSYINTENSVYGMMNMWALEVNGKYDIKDAYGNDFVFKDGDVMLFYTDKNLSDTAELKPIK